MSDLISREDIPYIDLNGDMPQSKVRVWVAFKEQIDALPSADAVEVVRCKDCKYWQDNNGGYPNQNCRWNEQETPDADDFCSAGERREP